MKTLLLVAACLAIANAQHAIANDDAPTMSRAPVTTMDLLNDHSVTFVNVHSKLEQISEITRRAYEHHDLDEEGRRLWIEVTANPNSTMSSGAIIFQGANNEIPGKMDATTCFDLCMKLKESSKSKAPALFQHHNWLMGPVRDQTETNHIVRVMNAIWKDKIINYNQVHPTAQKEVVSFWPTNGTEAGEPNSSGDFATYNTLAGGVDAQNDLQNDLKNGVNRMWIGLFGDVGQKDASGNANKTLPFIMGNYKFYSKEWIQSEGYQYESNPLSVGQFLSTSMVADASSFYPFLAFQNFSMTTTPNWKTPEFPKLSESPVPAAGSLYTPKGACVVMSPSSDANTFPGQWENIACNNLQATACFCRAVCSVAEADACHRLRKCSTDGTSIVDNYEFDYENCKCARVAPKRCCTECGGDDNTTDTNGRLVPTECRGAVPGDPFYVVGGVYADRAQFPDEALQAELKGMYTTVSTPNDPRQYERGYKQCRRIRFGSPKVPIYLGNADNTLDVYNAADLRRDLPAQ